MLNQIHLGDCLEVMTRIPDGSVDMVLCDLPYGTTRNKWDSPIPLDLLWASYDRIVKPNGVIVLTAQTPFDKVLGASKLDWLRYEWIWQKNIATGHLNADKAPMKNHENVLVFYRKPPLYSPQMRPGAPISGGKKKGHSTNYGHQPGADRRVADDRYPVSVLEFPVERGMHPTQKPVTLFEYLIRTYTNPGDTVLDNCIGSGTTAVAARNLGRHFIGIEQDPKHYQTACERLSLESLPSWLLPPKEPVNASS